MEIRDYQPEYRNQVMSLSIRTITEEVDLENTHFELKFLADLFKEDIYQQVISDGLRRLWVIIKGERVYGYLSVRVNHIGGYINGLYLEPDLRGKGWAKQLLDKAIKFCQEFSLNQLKVSAAHYSKSAIAFYKKNGFQHIYDTDENGGNLTILHFKLNI